MMFGCVSIHKNNPSRRVHVHLKVIPGEFDGLFVEGHATPLELDDDALDVPDLLCELDCAQL
jgi:hypothetical protein